MAEKGESARRGKSGRRQRLVARPNRKRKWRKKKTFQTDTITPQFRLNSCVCDDDDGTAKNEEDTETDSAIVSGPVQFAILLSPAITPH